MRSAKVLKLQCGSPASIPFIKQNLSIIINMLKSKSKSTSYVEVNVLCVTVTPDVFGLLTVVFYCCTR